MTCLSLVSCGKTCKCVMVETGDEWGAEVTKKYDKTLCEETSTPGFIECKMQ